MSTPDIEQEILRLMRESPASTAYTLGRLLDWVRAKTVTEAAPISPDPDPNRGRVVHDLLDPICDNRNLWDALTLLQKGRRNAIYDAVTAHNAKRKE